MKNPQTILALFSKVCLVLLLTTACEKVIDIDLNEVESKYVVEAEIIADSNYASVRITRTKNFTENNTFSPVPNALVTILDDTGLIDTLRVQSDGSYFSSNLRGVQNRKYTLTILVDGKRFISTSTIPTLVPLENISIDSIQGLGGGGKQFIVTPKFADPKGLTNFYRFVISVNGKTYPNVLAQNDEFNDGLINRRPLNIRDLELVQNDTVSLEMQCIDASNYNYFQSLSQLTGNGQQQAATPTNPLTNVEGGAIGYFNARTSKKLSLKVRQ